MKNIIKKDSKDNKGITLIALVVTIIILLILAGVALSAVLSDRGIFKRAEDAGERHNEAKAREALETVLLGDGQYDKHTNPEYNQDDYLDELIIAEIKGSDVQGDIAIVDGYAYELDRSVPKIGHYVGKASDLIFPEVKLSKPVVAGDSKTATFTITAKEEKNGIDRIEVWLEGQKVSTIPCNNEKTPAPITYTANRNGTYTVKAISVLTGSARTKVEGLVASVKFTPNGSTTYEQGHSTKIVIQETADSVTEVKYKWTDSVTAPGEGEFSDSTTNNSTITGSGMNGKQYLWVMLKTASGKTNICGSEAFNFDNEGPTVDATPTAISETSFEIDVTASDTKSGVASYEFYVDGEKKDPDSVTDEGATYTWNGTEAAEKDCYVIVTDKAGNTARKDVKARTLMHSWKKYKVVRTFSWTSSRLSHTGYIPWLGFDEDGNGYVIEDGASSITPGCGSCTLRGYAATNTVTYTQPRWCGDSNGNTWTCGSETDPVNNIKLTSKSTSKGDFIETVYDKDINKYPENGEADDFWYEYDGLK